MHEKVESAEAAGPLGLAVRHRVVNESSAVAQGNMGALTVLQRIWNDLGPNTALYTLGQLRRRKLYGAAIWVLYKDECGQDLLSFVKRLSQV